MNLRTECIMTQHTQCFFPRLNNKTLTTSSKCYTGDNVSGSAHSTTLQLQDQVHTLPPPPPHPHPQILANKIDNQ